MNSCNFCCAWSFIIWDLQLSIRFKNGDKKLDLCTLLGSSGSCVLFFICQQLVLLRTVWLHIILQKGYLEKRTIIKDYRTGWAEWLTLLLTGLQHAGLQGRKCRMKINFQVTEASDGSSESIRQKRADRISTCCRIFIFRCCDFLLLFNHLPEPHGSPASPL